MEESKALVKLMETADLVAMVEELMSPGSIDKVSSSTWSGIRVTLRNVKEAIRSSHGTLAESLIVRARNANGSGLSSSRSDENGEYTRNVLIRNGRSENGGASASHTNGGPNGNGATSNGLQANGATPSNGMSVSNSAASETARADIGRADTQRAPMMQTSRRDLRATLERIADK